MKRETLDERAARIAGPETDEQRRDRLSREHMRLVRLAECQATEYLLRLSREIEAKRRDGK